MKDLIAITVSVNYHNLLPLILETNHRHFKHWYIVTEKTDTETQQMCKKYPNVEVLFFEFKSPDSVFNFGGARRYGQLMANKNFKEDFKLMLDSDICLPDNFQNILESTELKEEVIYGAPRLLVDTVEEYKHPNKAYILDDRWVHENRVIGFFQLYKSDILYQNSFNCAVTDEEFTSKFDEKKFLNLTVHHIGQPGKNWNGR
jgi:hypothetical protein